jgi:hypothetical protein
MHGTITPGPVAIAVSVAAQACDLTREEILGENKHAPMVRARDAIIWAVAKVTGRDDGRIGYYLGGRDCSTICDARKRADARYSKDPEFRRLCNRIATAITIPLANRLAEDAYGWEDIRRLTALRPSTCQRLAGVEPVEVEQ